MENSSPSPLNNQLAHVYDDDDYEDLQQGVEVEVEQEESGWTQYLIDFDDYNKELRRKEEEGETTFDDDDHEDQYSNYCSASMASDAGSGPEWKPAVQKKTMIMNNNISSPTCVHGFPKTPRRLNFKKKGIAKEIIPFDDDLEDTASSPVNSPKIALGMKRMDINSRKTDENFDSHLGKGGFSDHQSHGNMAVDGERFHDQTMLTRRTDGSTDLQKQKGLMYSAPVSMFMTNYAD